METWSWLIILTIIVCFIIIIAGIHRTYYNIQVIKRSFEDKKNLIADMNWVKKHPKLALEYQQEIASKEKYEQQILERENTQHKIEELIKEKWIEVEQFFGDDCIYSPVSNTTCMVRKNNDLIIVGRRNPCIPVEEYEQLKQTQAFDLFHVKKICCIENIIYFRKQGEIQYTTNISGGGGKGGGVNVGGAVAGGILFGAAGAIVGAQAGTETFIDPVESTTVKHDTRKTIFQYNDENQKIVTIEWPIDFFALLMKVIPEKEYDYLQLHKKNEPTNASNNLVDTMKQYKELLDSGVITLEEFETKKKQLLGL